MSSLAQPSTQQLLQAVERLDSPELDQFVSEVLKIRARRVAPSLSEEESALFAQINEGLPDDMRRRFEELEPKRWEETITPEELAEMIRISDFGEHLAVRRVEALTRLAQIRQKTVAELMQELGLVRSEHG